MRVLIIGSGGREHALAWKISRSPILKKLYCTPGNPGTALIAENVSLESPGLGTLALWAVENKIDLTIVGPENPLAEGLVDVFQQHGLKVFGPTKAAAQLESSKSYAKEIMQKAGVRTPIGETFTDYDRAREYLSKRGVPVVIKADGLCAGKGVVVAFTETEALDALQQCFVEEKFGSAGNRVVIEEFIQGHEASVMAIVDEDTVLPLVVSQDHKRLLDANKGPNTGGMGAISPTPVLSDKKVETMVGEIFIPVIEELLARGIKYRGFLYAGVIVDTFGVVRVLEFNCRLGDPETQVLMLRLESDLLMVLEAAVNGQLGKVELKWTPNSAVCVVLASKGYPTVVEDGKIISGLSSVADDIFVFHAGTKLDANGEVISKGGRVLTVSALGHSIKDAAERVYQGVQQISFDGMQYRTDIGQ